MHTETQQVHHDLVTSTSAPTAQEHQAQQQLQGIRTPTQHVVSLQDPYFAPSPNSLEGIRCYTDASRPPDNFSTHHTTAGIGIFIINTSIQPSQYIYIKATLNATASVLMAEAAALALAALVTDKLGFQQVHFLSDSQQLVHFLNAQDRSNPPQWRIKYYTHMFINSMANRNIRTWKIQRTQLNSLCSC